MTQNNGVSATELFLYKIYENLSIQKSEINTVKSIGNNIMFVSRQVGYIIVPNKYTASPEDIQIFKLTDNVSNMLVNPSGFIKQRLRLGTMSVIDSIEANYNTFIENSFINLIVSYKILYVNKTEPGVLKENTLVVMYRYSQTNRHWSLYDTKVYDQITNCYICEPNLNYQFIIQKNNAKWNRQF